MMEFDLPVPQEVALIIPNFRNSYAVGWLGRSSLDVSKKNSNL